MAKEEPGISLETTCVIIKPDAVRRELVGTMMKMIASTGSLAIKSMRRITLTSEEIDLFYRDHEGRFYFHDLKVAMKSGPSWILVLEGFDAVKVSMKLKAKIRSEIEFSGGPYNGFHCSDDIANGKRESDLADRFFCAP